MYKIPLSYNPIDHQGLANILQNYEGRHHQQLVTDFESALARLTGATYVVALNSGTAAVHLALKAVGISRGDVVLSSDSTYIASANPILYEGAMPFFVDSEWKTWNLDAALLDRALQRLNAQGRPAKALILVHSYGMPADLDSIMDVANKFGVKVIEDAAESIGATWNGRHTGTFGEVGVLSFNNNKTLTTYGGGAVLTNSRTHHANILHWATQARDNVAYYRHTGVGYNYRMGPLNAAVGLLHLSSLAEKLHERRMIWQGYRAGLADYVRFPEGHVKGTPNHWLSVVLMDENRPSADAVQQRLAAAGVESRRLWNPMHRQPVFDGNHEAELSGVSIALFERGLALPSAGINDSEQEKIISIIRSN